MTQQVREEVRGAAVLEHPAVQAWLRVRPAGVAPAEVTLLKEKGKSAVYRLAGVGPGGSAVVAKRCRPASARVEGVVYGAVLARLPVPSLRYYGCVEGPEGCWLFLEESVADKYLPALEEHRRLAGRWLGLLHASAAPLADAVPLPDRGPGYFQQCLCRVRDTVRGSLGHPGLTADDRVVLRSLVSACDVLEAHWPQVEQLCAGMPRTLVHGDFIKRNLRVRSGTDGPQLVPYDWEFAGWGPPAADLARPPSTGCVDLAAYRDVVGRVWPDVDLPTVQRWAALGSVFRFLIAADWEAPKLTDTVDKSVERLAIYRGGLTDALRALGWWDERVKASLAYLPDPDSLAAGLTSALAGVGAGPAFVMGRLRNPHASTFPSEVVTCRLGGGGRLRLFCKYATGCDHPGHGHRGGVDYEAEVYRRVLAPAGLPVPRFYGAPAAGPAGEVWLVLGYLERSLRLRDSIDLDLWEQAAAWSGRFHAAHEAINVGPALSFLNAYDAGYYAGWARRTAEYAGALQGDFPWLAGLCRRAEAALAGLLEAPRTVIHGEYYPRNLLINGGTVYPVDWESAAFGTGEIDLATLTDHCEPEIVCRCELAYQQARWPEGAPPGFARALELARLYVHLRWLGDEPGGKLRRRFWRYEEVRALGERLGLL